MREPVGFIDAEELLETRSSSALLKRSAMLFDQLGVHNLSLLKKVLPRPKDITDDFDWLEDSGMLFDAEFYPVYSGPRPEDDDLELEQDSQFNKLMAQSGQIANTLLYSYIPPILKKHEGWRPNEY